MYAKTTRTKFHKQTLSTTNTFPSHWHICNKIIIMLQLLPPTHLCSPLPAFLHVPTRVQIERIIIIIIYGWLCTVWAQCSVLLRLSAFCSCFWVRCRRCFVGCCLNIYSGSLSAYNEKRPLQSFCKQASECARVCVCVCSFIRPSPYALRSSWHLGFFMTFAQK